MANSNEIVLEMKNICKKFPSVKALDGAYLKIKRGTVHALMGENGAGKSTLMKVLFGIHIPDEGEIFLNGARTDFKNPKHALENGVAMVHQELNQALKRSVMDNMWLGRYPKKLGIIVDEKKMYKDTLKIFDELKITLDPNQIMNELPVAKRQMAEIAKAVSYNAKIIVLDEPTSSLSDTEVARLFEIIERLKKRGCAIIYISHKMEEILKISDEITVMRDGKHIATHATSELDMNTIIKLMVGRELGNRFPPKSSTAGETLLEVKGLTAMHSSVKNVSFSVKAGEIVGIAGLDGSGRTELLECIFGMAERKSGSILLKEKPTKNRSPSEAKRNGFALLTEERRKNGIFANLNICENTVISNLSKYLRAFLCLSDKKMEHDTATMISALRIKTPSQNEKIGSLSGGNQQKVILGRWLLTSPDVLLLDEPTRGIDVGAKYEIYQLITELASTGKAIIMVSSEMPELLGVASRLLVMSGGELVGELDAESATQEQIMHLATSNI